MVLKYIFDRLLSLVGLLLLWPLLIIIAILIKIKMPGGPAFFVQKRVGMDGELFDCHKFRTMTVRHNGSSVSVAGDSRITPFGATGPATLKYRLEDEMLADVRRLMSEGRCLPAAEIAKMTNQELAIWYNDNVIYPDKVRLNCYYYRNYSFIKDIQMILCTVLGKKMYYAGEQI